MKIQIDFCDFWPGFSKTDNFFVHLLRERFEVEIADYPDFLFYANPNGHLHRVHNCVKIYFGTEIFLPDFRECDYALTCHYLDHPRHFRLPYYLLFGSPERLRKTDDEPGRALESKTRFCSFLVTNWHPKKTRVRTDFFHRLSKYKKVDSAGGFLNNTGAPLPRGGTHKLDFLRTRKFHIAFENGSTPGYTTEKIVEAMRARTLPIYWGNPRIAEEFNPRSFLNYHEFPDEEALIEKIIELDQDDARYLDYFRQPYFQNDTPNESFNRERLLDHFEKIFTTKIQPVSSRRSFFQIVRWIPVKKNRPHSF
jgi:hypothetical protein